jgi:diadenosine tetraphosphate (Ap4A) HIT family hydrolase
MERIPIDHDEVRSHLSGVCFICELVAGTPEHFHHVIVQNDTAVAFLSKYPTLYGYTIVAPTAHMEKVVGDFTEDEYAELQRFVHRIGSAIEAVLPVERLYVLSLGSQTANSHVHWHVAPLPPGVPFEEQQYRALDRTDCLDIDDAEMDTLARRIRAELVG